MARTISISAKVDPEMKATLDYITKQEKISLTQLILNALTLYISRWDALH